MYHIKTIWPPYFPFSLVTLAIFSLRNLDIEANELYNRAHRLYNAAFLLGVILSMLFDLILTLFIILGILLMFNL